MQQAVGYGSAAILTITERFTFAEDFYRVPLSEKLHSLGRYRSLPQTLGNTDLRNCADIIKRCEKLRIEIVAYGDAAYPELLRHIDSPPAVLFVKGEPAVLSHELCLGVVGTRRASEAGRKNAFRLSYKLAREDICIVSGGAVGIDTQAHLGALRAGGKTICVLGCGHAYPYLPQYDDIKRETVKTGGAVISEFPPDMPPSKRTFPMRNRLISGLSKGVIVIEAGFRSGSLITAHQALEQGRDVFALPGSISDPNSIGTNELIKEGAIPVTRPEDILSVYRGVSDIPARDSEKPSKPESVTEKDEKLEPKPPKKETPAELPYDEETPAAEVREQFGELDVSVFLDYFMAFDKGAATSKSAAKERKRRTEAASAVTRAPRAAEKHSAKPSAARPERYEPVPAPKAQAQATIPEDISENAAKIMRALSSGELHIDVIAEKTGLPISAVHAAATELEMSDLVECLEGRRYKLL